VQLQLFTERGTQLIVVVDKKHFFAAGHGHLISAYPRFGTFLHRPRLAETELFHLDIVICFQKAMHSLITRARDRGFS
jgi:hypothetical protein